MHFIFILSVYILLRVSKPSEIFEKLEIFKFHEGCIFVETKFKKIWCASRARVNLPQIGNRGNAFNLFCNKTQVSTFLRRNFYGIYPYIKLLSKVTSFVLGWSLLNLLNQTQVLTSLSRNLYEGYPIDVKFQLHGRYP
jgi:hypothetical protein